MKTSLPPLAVDCTINFISLINNEHISVPQELFSSCNPIVTKPKPKVEVPKDDKPAEQNGPVNGQENPEAVPSATDEAPTNRTEGNDSKPDMDLD